MKCWFGPFNTIKFFCGNSGKMTVYFPNSTRIVYVVKQKISTEWEHYLERFLVCSILKYIVPKHYEITKRKKKQRHFLTKNNIQQTQIYKDEIEIHTKHA